MPIQLPANAAEGLAFRWMTYPAAKRSWKGGDRSEMAVKQRLNGFTSQSSFRDEQSDVSFFAATARPIRFR